MHQKEMYQRDLPLLTLIAKEVVTQLHIHQKIECHKKSDVYISKREVYAFQQEMYQGDLPLLTPGVETLT